MKTSSIIIGLLILALVAGAGYLLWDKPANQMTFFVSSTNPGKGADLGGLNGADNYCQSLAKTAGAGNLTWRAYLSTTASDGTPAVNARDRIGQGPWKNFNGEVIANNVQELHSNNNINKNTALTEKGEIVSGRGDAVNQHDILTGSTPDGRSIAGSDDSTCGNWTKSGDGAAMVGHHDRTVPFLEFVASFAWMQPRSAGQQWRWRTDLLLCCKLILQRSWMQMRRIR